MKKLVSLLLICIMVLSFSAHAMDITVFVDDTKIEFDVPPTSESGRTLVPMRYIFEALGAEVDWIAEDNKVVATKDDTTIELVLGSNIMLKNGEEIVLDVPAKAIEGRTLVPVRAISEALDAKVDWIGEEFKVDIKSASKDIVLTEEGAKETAQAFIDAVSEMDFFKALEYMENGEEIRSKMPEGTYTEIMASTLADMLTNGTGELTGTAASLKETIVPLITEVLKAYASRMDCSITDVKATENGYTFTISVTLPDEESLASLSEGINTEELSVEIANKLVLEGKISSTASDVEILSAVLPEMMRVLLPQMTEIVLKADCKTTTEEITLEIKDGKWKIVGDDFAEELFDISVLAE